MVRAVTRRSRNPDLDDPATLAAVGILAATLAQLSHEAVGHGTACLAAGGEIVRLSALFFRCRHGNDLVDLAGPLGSLACGLLALAGLRIARGPTARLFLLTLAMTALFWFFGQLARDAGFATDDWAFAVHSLGPRIGLAAIGVAGYAALIRGLVGPARSLAAGPEPARRLLTPWLAAIVSAVLAGALFRHDPTRGALEGLLTLGAACLGWLLTVRAESRGAVAAGPAIGRSWAWIGAAGVAFAAFALVVAPGLGG